MVKVTRAFGDTRAWLGGTYGREAQYSLGGLLAVEPVIAGLVRRSLWPFGFAWAIGGGATFVVSVKSGIWGGVDAPVTPVGIPNAVTQRQRTTVFL